MIEAIIIGRNNKLIPITVKSLSEITARRIVFKDIDTARKYMKYIFNTRKIRSIALINIEAIEQYQDLRQLLKESGYHEYKYLVKVRFKRT